MRKNVIAGNWKMNKTLAEAIEFVEEVTKSLPSSDKVESVVCAPFVFLPDLVKKAEGSELKIAAQNMHFEEKGAFTGEVSPAMLEELGVSYVVIGHSERREHFAETDETVNRKVHAAFAHNMTPIVCVGESLEQRENNETNSHVEAQVRAAIEGLDEDQIKQLVIAYEPIWAIGTGKTATSDMANEVCQHIRSILRSSVSEAASNEVRLQYGGSVKPDNIDELLEQSDVDGALVGGASVEAGSFLKLVEAGAK